MARLGVLLVSSLILGGCISAPETEVNPRESETAERRTDAVDTTGEAGVSESKPNSNGRSPGFAGEAADEPKPNAVEPTEKARVSGEASRRNLGPVIGTLQRRDDALVITASNDGPRFTVRDADGSVAARELSEAELRDQFRGIYQMYESGVAQEHGGATMDARGDPDYSAQRNSTWQRAASGSRHRVRHGPAR